MFHDISSEVKVALTKNSGCLEGQRAAHLCLLDYQSCRFKLLAETIGYRYLHDVYYVPRCLARTKVAEKPQLSPCCWEISAWAVMDPPRRGAQGPPVVA